MIRVLAVAALIVVVIGLYLARSTARDALSDDRAGLLPYQKFARELPSSEQHTFRALQQALLAAERSRASTGLWPEPAAVVANGVSDGAEQFVTDADNHGLASEWRLVQKGLFTNYLGVPAEPATPDWLVFIQEPDPNGAPDRAPNDEEHHRLPDGTVLHVSVWRRHLTSPVSGDLIVQPQLTGWTEIVSVVPLSQRR